MTEPKPPARLIDADSDAPEAVREVLRAGRSELPSAAQLARMASRLPIGTPPAASSPAAPPAASTAAGSLIPSALTGAAIAVVVVIGYAWRTGELTPAPVSPPITTVAERPRAAPPEDRAPAEVPAPAREVEPRAATAASSPTAIAPSAATPIAASAPEVIAETPPATNDAPVGGSGLAPPDHESEAHLLGRAQDALGGDPGRALALAGEHARRFPGGALAQERELIAVDALVRAGRPAEARERAERFLQAFPRSAHRRRIESIVGAASVQKNEPVAPPTR